jgi:hypothetical protein
MSSMGTLKSSIKGGFITSGTQTARNPNHQHALFFVLEEVLSLLEHKQQ